MPPKRTATTRPVSRAGTVSGATSRKVNIATRGNTDSNSPETLRRKRPESSQSRHPPTKQAKHTTQQLNSSKNLSNLISIEIDLAKSVGKVVGNIEKKELEHAEDLVYNKKSELTSAIELKNDLDELRKKEFSKIVAEFKNQLDKEIQEFRDILDQDEVNRKYFVDLVTWMSNLIQTLPEKAEALKYIALLKIKNEELDIGDISSQISKLDRAVNEIENVQSWIESHKTTGAAIPQLNSL
ncbi:hypothetical protein H4219_001727 [Mycoemilia scoparia]|uniref:Uncharacterized protein n=1 Tax=Mycoemilia scoparia TaxID=417184 RepID=A0A9W8DUZ8_9FUNG|nr:hypothetical protein H4219_001727 [Mycoemilia scoparia]